MQDEIKKSKDESVEYICSEIKHIITTFDKRDPGSAGERQAQEYMKDELSKYTDEVCLEDFKVHPKSFYGWIRFDLVLLLLAIALYFFIPFVSVCLVGIVLLVMLGEFIMYRKITDKFYKAKTSCNVTALKKPTGQIKRRILFNGHADATWEWTINYRFGGKVFSISVVTIVVAIFYVGIISILASAFKGITIGLPEVDFMFWLGVGSATFFPIFIMMWFFSNQRVVVDGANDNLTGCYIPIALMKALKDHNIQLENTEVGVILTGSEEAGLRGAKAWAKQHKDDFMDVPTFIVSFDTIYELNCLNINDLDMNSLCVTDMDVCSLLKTASQNTNAGAKFYAVTVGATDAAAFAQAGFKSACVTALDHSLKPYYHTRFDSWDLLNKECLAKVYEMSCEALKLFDNGNFDNCYRKREKAIGIRKKFPLV